MTSKHRPALVEWLQEPRTIREAAVHLGCDYATAIEQLADPDLDTWAAPGVDGRGCRTTFYWVEPRRYDRKQETMLGTFDVRTDQRRKVVDILEAREG